MTLTKVALIEMIQEAHDIPKQKSSQIIETLLEIIKSTLEKGEDVLVSGFGKFCVKKKTSRRGRNPVTGADLQLDARKVVVFKCSGVLRENMNSQDMD